MKKDNQSIFPNGKTLQERNQRYKTIIAHALKSEFKKEFLGKIPINPEVGASGDKGIPIVENIPEHEISKIYIEFANKIKSSFF